MQRNSHTKKNKPSLDFLRENAHLRVRTNMFGAIIALYYRMRFTVIFRRKVCVCEYANYHGI
jgi:aspartyl/asparaginyl-tRNA synthetase